MRIKTYLVDVKKLQRTADYSPREKRLVKRLLELEIPEIRRIVEIKSVAREPVSVPK